MFKGSVIAVILLAVGLSAPAIGAELPFEPFRVIAKDPRAAMKRLMKGQPVVPEKGEPAPAKVEAPATAVGAPKAATAATVPTPRARPVSTGIAPTPASASTETGSIKIAPPEAASVVPPVAKEGAPAESATAESAAAAAERDVVLPPPRPQIAKAIADPPVAKPAPTPEPKVAALSPVDKETVENCGRTLAALGIDAVPLAPIHDGACGVAAPAAIASLDGGAVTLTEKAIVNCAVAGALAAWMDDDVAPAAKKLLGGEVTSLRVSASYDCRSRNHVAGAQLSEHAFGNALDISAFKVAGLGWVEVGHTKSPAEADFMGVVRKDACGPFTTVLGPGQAYHDEHLHLDLAKRGKNGQSLYCK